jgi:hypothetical protein
MASAAQIEHSGSGTDDRANDQAAAQSGGYPESFVYRAW